MNAPTELSQQFAAEEQARLREFTELSHRDLEESRGHHARAYETDARAAQWFGAISFELNMLPLLARQASERTGVQITGMESVTLAEAEAVRSLKTPEALNSWIAVHSHNPSYPDARAAAPQLYCIALQIARNILGETLRIVERVGRLS
jgi:hypothetical protein